LNYPLISFYKYEGIAKEILHLSKYPPYYFYLLKYLSKYTFSNKYSLISKFLEVDFRQILICEVPISSSRVFERGFNQSYLISETLSDITGIDHVSFLKRNRNTKPLYELNFEERESVVFESVKAKFYAKYLNFLKKELILIVDDVYTSGSTLKETARAVKTLGYKKIQYLTLFTI